MKLYMLPDVLFDEFPSDETIKYCFFTQPKYPEKDYNKYKGKVHFYCTQITSNVMDRFKKLPFENFRQISERRKKFHGTIKFGVRCVPTGNPSGSVMLLIDIGEQMHLYTGQFTQCQAFLAAPIVLHYKDRINDIYVDNTVANLNVFTFLPKACREIRKIVHDHMDFKIYLDMELFGYEELLFELARFGLKIQLHNVQQILFEECKRGDLFKFDGKPQIKVWCRIQGEKPFRKSDYERCFAQKIIHIKLITIQHELNQVEKINGLFLVPYVPHAGSYALHCLFQALQPKRVHPLVPQDLNGFMSNISFDILDDECEIVDYETEGNPSFLALSEELYDISSTVSYFEEDAIKNVSVHLSDEQLEKPGDVPIQKSGETKSIQCDDRENSETGVEHVKSVAIANQNIEVTTLDDDEEDNDYQFDNEIEQIHETSTRKIVQNQAENESVEQNDANSNENDHTTTETDQGIIIQSNKIPERNEKILKKAEENSRKSRTRVNKNPKHVHFMKVGRIEYLSDTEEENGKNENISLNSKALSDFNTDSDSDSDSNHVLVFPD